VRTLDNKKPHVELFPVRLMVFL